MPPHLTVTRCSKISWLTANAHQESPLMFALATLPPPNTATAGRRLVNTLKLVCSGLTFAMFKANALDPDLAAVDASFRNIGYASGFAFDHWKTGINCMLLKKTNNYLVNNLRTILLLEANSGMNLQKAVPCRDVVC